MKRLLTTVLLAAGCLQAQQIYQCRQDLTFRNDSFPTDGVSNIKLTAGAAVGPNFNNSSTKCASWIMTYSISGISAVSIQLQTAAEGPGTFAAFQGTIVQGNNPSTVATSATLVTTGYYPWLNVNVASSTGTGYINVSLIGFVNLNQVSTRGNPAGVASLGTATSSISNSETLVISYTIPANSIKQGTTYRFTLSGIGTSTVANTSHLRIRLGTAGTSSDTAIADDSITAATSGNTLPFLIIGTVTFQSTTISEANILIFDPGASGINNSTIGGTRNNTTGLITSVNNIIQFSFVSAATTTSAIFYTATIELVKA